MRRHPLLSRFVIVVCASLAIARPFAAAQDPPPEAMSMADIEEMMGPIALYPDSLLANVMAASVYPDEITAAHQFVTGGGDAAGIDQQAWESPVKSIAKAKEVLDFLAENIDWTTAVGEVYVTQSQDVMTAVQNLRAKAKASGALQSSEQMTVVEGAPSTSGSQTIIIESAQPEVVYVPQYNPQVVYAPAPVVVDDDDFGDAVVGGMIGFGVGLAVGEIFDDDDWDCDWDDGCVGWGHNDVDIDRDVNIETGDININSGNTVQGGDRNRETNVQGGDRTNVKGGNKNNNVGREGQKWEPNKQKVDQRQAQTGGKRASDSFRGASNQTSAARSKVPTKTSAATTRNPSKPLAANNNKPQINKAGDNRAGSAGDNRPGNNQPGSGSLGNNGNRAPAGGSARNASKPAPKAATKAPPSRPAPPKASAPKARPPTPSKPAPKAPSSGARSSSSAKSKPSGMSPSRGSSKASSRGASSRGGGGGGGGRGGGGRGR